MAKNFDEERNRVWAAKVDQDRTFVIGGETFVYAPLVGPEALVPWMNIPGQPEEEAIKLLDETVLNLLDTDVPGQAEKWAKVRDPKVKPPLTTADLSALIEWLTEAVADRPTGQPSGSSTGQPAGATTPPSTAASESPAAPA